MGNVKALEFTLQQQQQYSCNRLTMGGMGGGGLETTLFFGNICTKRLLSKSFTTEIVGPLYFQRSRNSREVMPWNHAPESKQRAGLETSFNFCALYLASFIQNSEHHTKLELTFFQNNL